MHPVQTTPNEFFTSHEARVFRRKLMRWYRAFARDLPWRGIRDPYRTWVSEIMLQQTRVAAAIDHYHRFLRLFPTIPALALASEDAVLAAWSGLGYYRRARMLHQAAQFLVRERGARLPATAAELRTLPGIGDYTSAAIASIAFGESVAVVDGNVERVLLRLTGRPEDTSAATQTLIRSLATSLLPRRRIGRETNSAGDHNQAIMELGATVCLPRGPLCLNCPVWDLCLTRGEHLTRPRERQQSQPIAYVLATQKRGVSTDVLLVRRDDTSSLMPGMLELPPLLLEAVDGLQPLLTLRHSITRTSYRVSVYAQPEGESPDLLSGLPVSIAALSWHPLANLHALPLTGLARKILSRIDLHSVAGPSTPLPLSPP